MPDEPRAYTVDEMRERFLAMVVCVADYWATNPAPETTRERCHGVAFSILVALDGANLELPGFKVIPNPHPEDKAYHQEEGSNWFPEDVDIGGSLHEHLHTTEKRLGINSS